MLCKKIPLSNSVTCTQFRVLNLEKRSGQSECQCQSFYTTAAWVTLIFTNVRLCLRLQEMFSKRHNSEKVCGDDLDSYWHFPPVAQCSQPNKWIVTSCKKSLSNECHEFIYVYLFSLLFLYLQLLFMPPYCIILVHARPLLLFYQWWIASPSFGETVVRPDTGPGWLLTILWLRCSAQSEFFCWTR